MNSFDEEEGLYPGDVPTNKPVIAGNQEEIANGLNSRQGLDAQGPEAGLGQRPQGMKETKVGKFTIC